MKRLLPLLLFGTVWLWSAAVSYFPQPMKGVVADLPATCVIGQEYFATNATAGQNKYFCTASNTWTQQLNSGGSGGSAFTGSTAVTSSFSATPTFSLADVSVKSPTRFEPAAMSANVTSVTFSNKTAGAKFAVVWLQDATGGRTVAYGASASNTCAPSATASKYTEQFFEVAADGSTVFGTGCGSNDALDAAPTVGASVFSTLTDGATITWAIGSVLNSNGSVTLGGNRTLNITSPLSGGNYVLKIIQDGTGSRTLALGTGCTWKVIGGGSGAITLSTAAASIDILAFTFDGTNCLANLGKNYN